MKKLMQLSVVLAAAALVFSSCNCFKKMAKNRDEVQLNCTPEVLVLNKGVVAADLNATFPAKYFNKKAVLKVTPVMVFEGGEIAGSPIYLQGSKVKENYTVVDAAATCTMSEHVEFPYDPRMQQSELQLRAEIKCPSGKCKEFTPVNLNNGAIPTKEEAAILAGTDEQAKAALLKEYGLTIAYGVNTLQNDLDYAALMDQLANDFKKVTTVVDKADILYAINSSVVTSTAKKNADLEAFKANVDANLQNDRASQSITVKGYASPDGPEKFNDELSSARSKTGQKTIAQLLKDAGLEIDAAAYGEDWEGFKELVEKSNIKDKNLILQVLSLYSNSVQRESEIKNMASVFNELKEEILPQLRRSLVVNTTDIQGKTDAEILDCIKNGQELSAEEYLYAAQVLVKNPKEQAAILTTASKKYNDARIYNNLGVAQAELGDAKAALTSFNKAAKLDASAEVNNNLVMANLANGNINEAKKYAKAADAEAKAAVAAAEGNYAAAAKSLKGYNLAIAETMNANYGAAKKAIAADKSAEADYLRAVIAVQEGDLKTAEAQLKSAVKKEERMMAKAEKDVNLKALFENGFKF